jgi:hypothetical protein
MKENGQWTCIEGDRGVDGVMAYAARLFLADSHNRESAASIAQMEISGHRVENVLAAVEEMAQFHQAESPAESRISACSRLMPLSPQDRRSVRSSLCSQ